LAISATLLGCTAVVELGPELSVLLVQPVMTNAAEATIAPAIRHPRDLTIASSLSMLTLW
jgi:hypothetical protein